jgi:dTDP-4-dehydrorhamnose reductase
MLTLFEQREELNVVNDQYGSPTYTGELADFVVQLIKDDSDKYGVYHFSGEGMTNWHEFASEIYRLAVKYGITERKVTINPVDSSKYPQKAKRPAYSYMLKDKLYSTFAIVRKTGKKHLRNI